MKNRHQSFLFFVLHKELFLKASSAGFLPDFVLAYRQTLQRCSGRGRGTGQRVGTWSGNGGWVNDRGRGQVLPIHRPARSCQGFCLPALFLPLRAALLLKLQ